MHVKILVWLKYSKIEFLKIELTYPDNVITSQIPLHVCGPSWTQTGLSILRMIDSPRGVFDLELKQHKFAEESQEENKNPVNTRDTGTELLPKVMHK